jgi:gas vesicle protein
MNRFDRFLNGAGNAAGVTRRRADLAARGERGPRIGSVVTTGIIGAAAGAAASFLFDPARGRARRARLRDQGAATLRTGVRRAGQTAERLRATVEGRISAMRAPRSLDIRPTDDATLTDRISSSVFRDPSLPKGSINMNVERGVVVLRGEVPDQATRERLVAEVEAVDGVWNVRDLLHLPGEEPTSVAIS